MMTHVSWRRLRSGPLTGWLLVGVLAQTACGGSSTTIRHAPPLTPQDAEVFTNGVEFIGDPAGIGDRWAEDWKRDLERRIRRADLVAIVHIDAVETDEVAARGRLVRLTAEAQQVLWGKSPARSIDLEVHEADPGFVTVDGKESQILHRDWLACLKWYRTPEAKSTLRLRWSLVPPSALVREKTSLLLEDRAARKAEREY